MSDDDRMYLVRPNRIPCGTFVTFRIPDGDTYTHHIGKIVGISYDGLVRIYIIEMKEPLPQAGPAESRGSYDYTHFTLPETEINYVRTLCP